MKKEQELRAKLASEQDAMTVLSESYAKVRAKLAEAETALAREKDSHKTTASLLRHTVNEAEKDCHELLALREVERASREVCRLSDREQDPWIELKKAFAAVDAVRKEPMLFEDRAKSKVPTRKPGP